MPKEVLQEEMPIRDESWPAHYAGKWEETLIFFFIII